MLLFTWGKILSYIILLTDFTCCKINSMKQKYCLINTPSIIKILDTPTARKNYLLEQKIISSMGKIQHNGVSILKINTLHYLQIFFFSFFFSFLNFIPQPITYIQQYKKTNSSSVLISS